MTATNIARPEEAANSQASRMLPAVDVFEDASGITLYADMPGVHKDKINVRVEGDTLHINGEVTLPVAKDMEASHAEIQSQQYERSFTLGQELDRDKLAAEFKQGVLKLHIPKIERAKPRRIEVKVN